MDDHLKALYALIREGKVSPHEATQQLQLYRNQRLSSKENQALLFSKSYTHDENLLKDHRIFGEQFLMGVAHCSLALQALTELSTKSHVILSKVLFLDAIRLLSSETIQVDVVLKRQGERVLFENQYFKKSTQRKVATASGQIVFDDMTSRSDENIAISDWTQQSTKTISGDLFYKHISQETYGETLFSVKKVYLLDEAVLGEIELSGEVKQEAIDYVCHPAVLDAIHVTSSFAMDCVNPVMRHWVPIAIKKLRFIKPVSKNTLLRRLYCYVKPAKSNSEISEFDCKLYGEQGQLVIDIEGFCTRRVPSKEAMLGIKVGNTSASTSSSGQGAEAAVTHNEEKRTSAPGNTSVPLQEKIQEYLKEKIASLLGKRKHEIETRINLMDMGLESNHLVQMSQKIEESIGIELMPTIFFEYQNIDELSHYFTEEQANSFAAYFGIEEKSTAIVSPHASAVTALPAPDFKPSDQRFYSQDDIAIIGMDGRLAQSPDLRTFWEHVRNSKDLISEIPKSHWDYQTWFDENRDAPNKTYSKWGSFLHDIDKFDPLFFGMSPRQAVWVDPQLRILLEVIYGVLEDAGYVNQIRGSKTGMYTGVCFREYWDEVVRRRISITDYEHASSSMASLSGYISYAFDLQGGSIPLDNACASSLTATHLACQALKTGECDLALVAGTNVLLSPLHYVYFSRVQALSPTGRCHVFDKHADGYVPGEGVVAVLLKPLSRAIKDQDNIHAVIKGSAINHCGRSNNLTSPRPELQTKVLLEAWKNANINPETLSYIECHGTGTELGDPIEINALKKAFKEYTSKTNFCAVGSTKAYVGHLEGAAGLASVIKVVWSMKNKTIPTMPTFKELNPLIQLKESPLYINTEIEEWKTEGTAPRRAGVSSFGMTGNNAHIVIEEYIPQSQQRSQITVAGPSPAIIVLSAKTEKQLYAQAWRLLTAIQEGQFADVHLTDMSYTLQVGRESMDERLAVIAGSIDELEKKLKSFLEGGEGIEDLYRGEVKRNKEMLAALAADEDMAKTVDAWIARRKYAKLSDLWVKGLTFDWNKLYGDTKPYRISLPTYPFARESYWMPEPEIQAAGTIAEERQPKYSRFQESQSVPRITRKISLVNSKRERNVEAKIVKPAAISLLSPALPLSNFSPSITATQSLVQLDSLDETSESPLEYSAASSPEFPVELYDYADGVFCVKMLDHLNGNILTESMLVGLTESFRIIKEHENARVVLLTGGDEWFLSGGTTQKEMLLMSQALRLPLDCDVPVIAVMKGHSKGVGWLLGCLCDLMICGEESSYEYFVQGSTQDVSEEELYFFEERFGKALAQELLFSKKHYTGTELRDTGLGLPILPGDEVDAFALKQAYRISEAPQKSLVLLKKHFSQEMAPLVRNLSDSFAATSKRKTIQPGREKEKALETSCLPTIEATSLPALSEPKKIATGSEAVRLEAYSNGIALITLCETASKNTFSEAFVQGVVQAFQEIAKDPAYKVVVLTGYDQYFSGGGTKEGLLAIQEGAIKFTDVKIYSLPLECDIPVIAAMQGHAIGAGWSFGMFCDEAILSEESVYLSPYMKYGFTPGAGSTIIFPEKFGKDLGREILFTATEYKGDELKLRGIKMPVLPRPEVLGYAMRLARQLALSSREELIEQKNKNCQKLRERLEKIYAQELEMHEMSFLGSEEVLQRINTFFDEGAQPDEETEHCETEELEVRRSETDEAILERIRKTLRDTLADELRIQPNLMGDDTQFVDLGMDSIILVTWIRKITEAFGLSIPATKVYNHPTIAELATYVMKEGRQQGFFQPSEKEATTSTAQHKEPSKLEVTRDAYQERHFHPLLPSRENGGFRNVSKEAAAETKAHQEEKRLTQSIAIIGMAGQFPKSKTLDQFWDNLAQGRDCISEIPSSRWDITQYYDPDPLAPGKTYCKWMGILEDVAQFDPQFFNISRKEAQWMDPQQRLFLQCCWHCVEDSGYQASQLGGSKCGVFVGCSGGDYGQSIHPDEINAQGFMGIAPSILAARISYFLNLQGPCLAIDTACSSSLVAIASACDSLVLGSSDLALAGGVCVMASPVMHIMTSKAGMLSKEGRCYTFDQRANGFVPGEGVGVVLLKRLEDAERDGDQIHGVISGWGVNQDGRTNGITAPNQDSQARLENEIYAKFGIHPEEIQLIEAHGTATKLGDPVEVEALKESFKSYTQKEKYCALGSVKSNIGHTLAAAGIAGAIKILLSLKNQKIPPTIHFDHLNEHIELTKSPFYINTECKDWTIPQGQKRRSAISSFGFSGTNAHVVIEEYVSSQTDRLPDASATPLIFVLSARNKERLKEYAQNWLDFIRKDGTLDPRTDLADLAYTLQVGREEMEARLGMIVHSRRDLEEKLRSFVEGDDDIGDFYLGQVKRNRDTPSVFRADEDMARMIDAWIAKEKYAPILELWVKGLSFDWHRLYGDTKSRRISMPTYPFATERYWLPEIKPTTASMKTTTGAKVCAADQESTDAAHLQFGEEPIAREALRKELTSSLVKALYMNPGDVDMDRQFVDMGMDSILGVEWIQTINKRYDLNLSATTLYDHPTIDALAGFIEEALGKRARSSVPSAEVVSESVARTVVNRSEAQESFTTRHEPIAIIGMSGRYPGAQDLHEFWSNLIQGKNSVREIPKERWDVSRYYDPNPTATGKVYCKWLGVLEDIDCFDPLFFMISPTEAEGMDPQHRIFLEEGYKAFEDAGYSKSSLNNMNCGVYLGIMSNEYGVLAMQNVTGQSAANTSFAIGAARLPYYLNLKGPAIPVDTACSSSLVAAHLACQALSNGEIDMALVGGVSLYLTPESYISMCTAGMLSPEGRCKAFDDSADGFVPGEGVGAIVLKRLKEAQRDKDFIWGTIIGSGINQDGKTNGITAPSVTSQIELERGIYGKYNIDPESITYIETHGTGTKLGDPIELEALSTVFKEKTDRRNYCALGSVKSNIGHSSAAAGVASIQKVLLSLKHKELAPSLHYKKPNSHFNLENSPFFVNQERRPWTRETGQLHRAAISGFGFSGTNAHLVIEEYVPEEDQESRRIEINPAKPAIIVLSAKNKGCLRTTVHRLKEHISKELSREQPSINLADLAYTLQVGREGMEERLGMIVHSLEELKEKLAEIIDDEQGAAGVYWGEVKRNNDALSVFATDEDLARTIDVWIAKGKYSKILDLWVKGLVFDWNKLYADNKPRRMSLPTYPFARERYWLPTPATVEKVGTASIHPLLQQNTSNLSEQRFSSTFTGEEFFLTDHVVKGERVLPGVAYLEMARAAVAQSVGISEVGPTGITLTNVVWARPFVVGKETARVHIGLFPEDNKLINYEIYGEPVAGGEEPVVYGQGSAVVSLNGENGRAQVPALNLADLQAECGENRFSPAECYEAFRAMGIDYGPGHQGIEEVHVGRGQVLAKLSLPASVIDTQEQYVLHPSLMDAALQASIGLMMGMAEGKGALPFGLDELKILGRCSSRMWALIRSSNEGPADQARKLDIDVCDEAGMICVQMKGFTSRVPDDKVDAVKPPPVIETLILRPSWKEQDIPEEISAPLYAQHLVVLCELDGISAESMESRMEGVRCLNFKSKQAGIDKRFQSYASRVFEEIQSILRNKPNSPVLVQVVIPINEEKQLFSGLSGLLKTARIENPKIIGQVIELDHIEGIAERLKENSRSPTKDRIRYQDGKRWVAIWREAHVSKERLSIPWKEGGTYLITGGAGELGFILAKEIAQQVENATVILTGRSALNATKQDRLKKLESRRVRVEYKQVDVREKKAVRNLMQSILERFDRLDGIIHSAGVKRDNFIFRKTKEELGAVLEPKVAGLVNLDEASKNFRLDFFILFSSSAGAMGNIGQVDYATANAFMDAYASYRNHLVSSGQRSGQTLSINWPLWEEGGMRVAAETEKMMREDSGMIAMSTARGIEALYQSIASGESQVMVSSGHQAERKSLPAIAADLLEARAVDYLKGLVSTVIKLSGQQIEADAPFEKYGIDSIMVMQLTNRLEKKFGSLSKTLFFEYRNIAELSQYFVENYRERLTELLGLEERAVRRNDAEAVSRPGRSEMSRRVRRRFTPAPEEEATIEVAIIGISGRYPGARNLQEFLNNLRDGKDCISEIPSERWDHSQYFDEDKNKPGKTYSKWGGFLEGVDEFDPLFFGISPREAELMDPQERLFLECVYETLEDAGYTREDLSTHDGNGLSGSVGVYVGVMYEEYQLYGAQATLQGKPIALSGNASSVANRVSYFCNFHGPSMAVDTMCSSSLTTIHLACESIKRGECELAIAGGVNVSIHPNKYLMLGQGKFVSSNGRCESFGQGGDGYVPGEGVGAVLLKAKDKAIADGDHIYGIIKGTEINHGGKTSGYFVPNPNAQASVIGRVFKNAGIDPRTISYLEAHGTGTSLGDPIEITGLKKAVETYTQDKQFCAIGSAKSNIGHCESAAGIAGVTKVLLQLKTRQLFPSLHAETLNPNIDFENTPFVVQQELAEWKRPVIGMNGEGREYPRRAGISSFGAGGANAHVVIEEYIERDERSEIKITPQNPAIIPLSAKNEERLKEQARQLLSAIGEISDGRLADIAYTLQVGREGMEERLGLIVYSVRELEEKLRDFLEGKEDIADLYRGQVKRNKDTLVLFAADEDLQKAINAWIAKGKHTKLLDLWVKGLVFDWNRLYVDNKPRRMSLPTYPFARERYWVPFLKPRTADAKTDIATIQFLPETIPNLSEQGLGTKPSHIALTSLSEEETFFTSTNKIQQTLQRSLVEPQEEYVLEVMEKLEKGTLSLDEAISML